MQSFEIGAYLFTCRVTFDPSPPSYCDASTPPCTLRDQHCSGIGWNDPGELSPLPTHDRDSVHSGEASASRMCVYQQTACEQMRCATSAPPLQRQSKHDHIPYPLQTPTDKKKITPPPRSRYASNQTRLRRRDQLVSAESYCSSDRAMTWGGCVPTT